ncbi:SURF1 family protein [Thauera aromatica]|uniref:SURF1 family protein n=1 Tax=Thauera aromatica TaxID=59405 RepID=UPI001FFC8BC8|nr:SURF1 family protein [Thauera aromatica]MCK2095525.1 SURF1 family protein [Thauera aromatica]
MSTPGTCGLPSGSLAERRGGLRPVGQGERRARLRHGLALLAGVAMVALTVALGNWQLRRAQDKAGLQAALDAAAQGPVRSVPAAAALAAAPADPGLRPGQRLRLEGEWLVSATVFLDNRTHQGRAGYHVLTPLRLADGSGVVLVDRGWVAAGADRGELPEVALAAGRAVVEGRLHLPEASPFTLARGGAEVDGPDGGGPEVDGQDAGGRRWQVLDPARLGRQPGIGLPPCTGAPVAAAGAGCVAPWIVLQTSPVADGLVRDWPLPAAGIERHRGYAFQWYALAALAAVLTAGYARRLILRRRHEQPDSRRAGR